MDKNQQQNDFHYLPQAVEVRSLPGASEGEPDKITVFGYAALVNTRSREMKTWGGKRFVEEIVPGAFDATDFSDVRCCFEHRDFIASQPTLEFGVDARGLWYRYEHDPADPDHVRVLRKIQRGDVSGSSFMFSYPDDEDQEIIRDGDLVLRKIKRIAKVYDVGPVVTPAYPATSAFARSLDVQEELPGDGGDAGGDGSGDDGGPPDENALAIERRRLEVRRTLI